LINGTLLRTGRIQNWSHSKLALTETGSKIFCILIAGCPGLVDAPRPHRLLQRSETSTLSSVAPKLNQLREIENIENLFLSNAKNALCPVETLALLLHSTRNRTPAPAHKLSSISPIKPF
jgi:hypothetical protein